MAKADEGRLLTREELDDYSYYLNQKLPVPDKYATVTAESTTTGQVYRFANAEELKAADEEAKRNLQVQEETAARNESLRKAALKQAAKAHQEIVIPDRPADVVATVPPAVQR